MIGSESIGTISKYHLLYSVRATAPCSLQYPVVLCHNRRCLKQFFRPPHTLGWIQFFKEWREASQSNQTAVQRRFGFDRHVIFTGTESFVVSVIIIIPYGIRSCNVIPFFSCSGITVYLGLDESNLGNLRGNN